VAVARAACLQRGYSSSTTRCAPYELASAATARAAVLRRIFVFEFSEDGVSRHGGSVSMLGARVEPVQLEPNGLA